jgi:hypothetical protein
MWPDILKEDMAVTQITKQQYSNIMTGKKPQEVVHVGPIIVA